MNPRCSECGRFCAYDSDYSIPFGGPADMEPPDEEFYCAACASALEDRYVLSGWVPSPWVRAAWQLRAAKRLGLVIAGPVGAAWSVFVDPNKLPDGYEVRL